MHLGVGGRATLFAALLLVAASQAEGGSVLSVLVHAQREALGTLPRRASRQRVSLPPFSFGLCPRIKCDARPVIPILLANCGRRGRLLCCKMPQKKLTAAGEL
jgi:hypothetical protein